MMAFMARFWPGPEAQLPSPLGSVRLPSCADFLCWLWLVDWLLPQLTTAAGAWWQQWELTLVIFCWRDGGGRVLGSQKAGGAKGVGGGRLRPQPGPCNKDIQQTQTAATGEWPELVSPSLQGVAGTQVHLCLSLRLPWEPGWGQEEIGPLWPPRAAASHKSAHTTAW